MVEPDRQPDITLSITGCRLSLSVVSSNHTHALFDPLLVTDITQVLIDSEELVEMVHTFLDTCQNRCM